MLKLKVKCHIKRKKIVYESTGKLQVSPSTVSKIFLYFSLEFYKFLNNILSSVWDTFVLKPLQQWNVFV